MREWGQTIGRGKRHVAELDGVRVEFESRWKAKHFKGRFRLFHDALDALERAGCVRKDALPVVKVDGGYLSGFPPSESDLRRHDTAVYLSRTV